MISDSVFTEGVIFLSCLITQSTLKLLGTLQSWMFSILIEPTSSQAGEVTQLARFPWRFLPSMLSELLHYRHLVLSSRVITFVTITQPGFMLYTFMHSKSIFLSAFFITWVAFQRRFLQLFVIYNEVRSQSTIFGTYILAWVTFLMSLVLCQSLCFGSRVSL